MGKGGIPDRWRDYCNIGRVIKGTRFIALKVPLNAELLKLVPPEEKWGVSDVINVQHLGHVIDLTYTNRYYKGQALEREGVKHTKIKTPGRQVPTANIIQRFYAEVDQYFQEEPEKLVGVHCTHGLNRSGYLICRYMIEKLGHEPNDAINEFNEARGHEQERENLIEHLKTLKRGVISDVKSNPSEEKKEEDMPVPARRNSSENLHHKQSHFYSSGSSNYCGEDSRRNERNFNSRNEPESNTPHFYSSGSYNYCGDDSWRNERNFNSRNEHESYSQHFYSNNWGGASNWSEDSHPNRNRGNYPPNEWTQDFTSSSGYRSQHESRKLSRSSSKSSGSKRDFKKKEKRKASGNVNYEHKNEDKKTENNKPSIEASTNTDACKESTETEDKKEKGENDITEDENNVESEPVEKHQVTVDDKFKYYTKPLFSI